MTQETTQVKSKRNYCLGFFQGLACILIIFIHAEFPGKFGLAVDTLARFGVLLFFMISGYFLIGENSSSEDVRLKLKKRIKRILIIYVITEAIYVLSAFIEASIQGVATEWVLETFRWQNILYYIFCNRPFGCVISWFLLAMINSYILLYIFARHFINNKILPFIIASLSLVVIAFRTSTLAFNININGYSLYNIDLYHSWYACGLIFMSLGIIVRRYINKLSFIPTWILIVVMLFSLGASIGEGFLYDYLFENGLTYYVFNIVAATSMLIISIKHPLRFSKFIFAKFPDDWTMLVYILHYGLIFAVVFVLQGHMPKDAFDWTYPPIVMALSILAAVLIAFLLKFIKKKK